MSMSQEKRQQIERKPIASLLDKVDLQPDSLVVSFAKQHSKGGRPFKYRN